MKLVLGLILLLPLQALAAPATEKSIGELLTVTKTENLMAAMKTQMQVMRQNVMAQAGSGKAPNPEMQKELDLVISKFQDENLSFSKVKPLMIQVYKEAWTEEEVQDLLRFYKTPTGVKAVDTMPQAMQKLSTQIQGQLAKVMPKFQEDIKKIITKYGQKK